MTWLVVAFVLAVAAVAYTVMRPAYWRSRAERRKAVVALRAEQLQLSKTKERLADVTAHKEVLRELKTVTVPVTREELVVEKDGVEAARIPLSEERVEVATRTVPLNEVSVYQREWEENRQIEAVLKKEVARIETVGDVPCHEAGAAGEEYQPQG